MIIPISELHTIQIVNTKNKLIEFADKSGVHLDFLPDAIPGQQVVVTKDAETNIIINVTRVG